jgi:quercetin dioxygenase-like cupin family protein
MSYDGPGAVNARLVPAAAVPTLMVGSTRAGFVARGSETDGRFGLFRWEMPARASGAQPHFHRAFSESFYVLAGSVLLFDGRGWSPATPGDFLFVPDGGIHGFRNAADEPASMLILFTPGAPRERYFEELAENIASGQVLEGQELAAFYARHDQSMVRP